MRVLFVTVDGGGNIPPQLAVARVLRNRGAEVRFLGHRGIRDRVLEAGFDFESFATGTHFDPTQRLPLQGVMGGMTRVITDRRLGHDVIDVAHRNHADAVVIDMLLTAATHEVVAAGIPTVVFVHCFYRTVQDAAAGPVGWLLRLRGVPPLGAARSGVPHIVTARADLDPVRGKQSVRHVGAVRQGNPKSAEPQPIPRILVSLSTCAYRGQRRMLQNILDAVEPLPVSATVTVGPAIDASGLRVPANASLHSWLDHDDVLATASLVVGHGGHSTAMRAMSFGVPIIVMPANRLIDQKRVGAALQQAGAGILLGKNAGVRRIRSAVDRAISNTGYRESARRLGEQIRRSDGAVVAADAISRFASAYASH